MLLITAKTADGCLSSQHTAQQRYRFVDEAHDGVMAANRLGVALVTSAAGATVGHGADDQCA